MSDEVCRCRPQVGLAADWLRRDIIGVAESGGLQAQAYWLSTTLALGAFLKARAPVDRQRRTEASSMLVTPSVYPDSYLGRRADSYLGHVEHWYRAR